MSSPHSQRTTQHSVTDVLASLDTHITHSTSLTLHDLSLLQRINEHATSQYKAMADATRGLSGTDADYLTEKYADINRYISQVDSVEQKVSDLEKIVKELEEWTGELGE